MRRKILPAVAAVPLLLTAAAPAAADSQPARYTALGDSYAAGVAAGSYDSASGACHRSAHGYPALWAAEHHPAAFLDAACSGATAEDVRQQQVPALSPDTTLVTVTVGGNDLGFADAAAACLQPLTTDGRCDHALDETDRRLREELPDRLAALYRAVATAAPAARVVVAGYPHLLETGTTCWVGTEPRRARFNSLTDRLDELIRHQAAGQGFAFADVREPFAGHGVCTGGQEWITRIVLPEVWESFHPTADGQAHGYLPTVSSLLGQ